MSISSKSLITALAVALYLYFLLPATAVMFYELYHLTGIGPVYWGYSIFKAAGYYLGVYEHRLVLCLLVALIIILLSALLKKLRKA